MNERAALFRNILEHPEDDVPRLVYADWLEEHGEPERAAYIRHQCEFPDWNTSHPRARDLFVFEERFDPFQKKWDAEFPDLPGVKWWTFLYKRGFVESITVRSVKAYLASAPQMFAVAPIRFLEIHRITDRTLRQFLASPYVPRLRQLLLWGTLSNVGVQSLAEAPSIANLTSLSVWCGGVDDEAADTLAKSSYFQNLTALSFCGHSIGNEGAIALLESKTLANVTRLVLHGTQGFSKTVVRRLKKRFSEVH